MPSKDADNSNPGNFANDPKKASEAGKKGGEHSHDAQDDKSGSSDNNKGTRPDTGAPKGVNPSNAGPETS